VKALQRIERLLQCDPTAVEGLLGAISVQMGFWLALPRGAVLIDMSVSEIPHGVWGGLLIAIGVMRLVAIYTNHLALRQLAAFVSCVTWVAFALLFNRLAHVPSNPIFYSFAIASTWVLVRLRVGLS